MEASLENINKKAFGISILKKIIVVVFYFLMMNVISTPLLRAIYNANTGIDENLFSAIAQYIVYIPILIVAIILCKDEIKYGFSANAKMKYIQPLVFVLIGVVACYFANYIGSFISSLFSYGDNSANQEAIEEIYLSKYGLLLILDVCIIGPVVEELVFRGCIQRGLVKLRIHPIIAIIITSIIFGFIHVFDAGDYTQVFPYIFMGLALGSIFYKSDSIVESTIVHILLNTISTSLIFVLPIIQNGGF